MSSFLILVERQHFDTCDTVGFNLIDFIYLRNQLKGTSNHSEINNLNIVPEIFEGGYTRANPSLPSGVNRSAGVSVGSDRMSVYKMFTNSL